MQLKVSVLAGLAVLVCPYVSAQQRVSEDVFLEPFEVDHAALRALEGGVARAQGTLRRAGALANPTLAFAREQPADAAGETTWSLAWRPPLDGRRGLAQDAARSGVEAERSDLASDRLALRQELRGVFAAWSLGWERKELLVRQTKRVGELSARMHRLAEAGEVSGLAARRLALVLVATRAELAFAGAELARAEAEARAWRPDLGLDPRPVPPSLPVPREAEPDAERPDIAAARHRSEQAHFERRLRDRFFRFPEVYGGWQRLTLGDTVSQGPVFGFSWSIPLFDRDQGERAEADVLEGVREAELALTTARARAERRGRLAAYAQLRDAALEAATSLEGIERLVEATEAALRAGEASVTDLVDTLRSVQAARLGEIALREAALAGHREAERAMGHRLGGQS